MFKKDKKKSGLVDGFTCKVYSQFWNHESWCCCNVVEEVNFGVTLGRLLCRVRDQVCVPCKQQKIVEQHSITVDWSESVIQRNKTVLSRH